MVMKDEEKSLKITSSSSQTKKMEIIYEWIKCSNGAYPENAIEAGIDEKSGARYLVARASICGADIPGKFISQEAYGIPFGSCYIPMGDDQVKVIAENYEILAAPPGNLIWIASSNGEIVKNAIVGGKTLKGNERLYIGRAAHKQGLKIPGKISLRNKSCYVPYASKVHQYNSYDILVIHPDKVPISPDAQWQPQKAGNFTWVKCHNGHYPSQNTVKDPSGSYLVCRALVGKDGTLMPGQFCLKERICSIAYYGSHSVSANYEILVANPNSYRWEHSSSGLVASVYALPGGISGDNRAVVYIGLGHYNGKRIPGIVHLNRKFCGISTEGQDRICKSYDVLVANDPEDVNLADIELSKFLLTTY